MNSNNRKRLTTRFAVTGFGVALTLVAVAVPAQANDDARENWTAPRTYYDAPDLQGIWTNATITTLVRPNDADSLVITAQEAVKWEQRQANFIDQFDTVPEGDLPAGSDPGGYNAFWIDPGTKMAVLEGEIRTSLIVDPPNGKIPYRLGSHLKLFQFLRRVLAAFDGPEQRPLGERCILGFGSTGGPPMLPVLYNNHYQIVQSKDTVMILVEMNHDARIIRLNGTHPAKHIRKWMGDSIGHWDGDTLVVETTNFTPGQSYRAAIRHQLYTTEDLKVTERFTRVSDKQIRYEFTMDDPGAFTQTWRAEMPLNAADGHMYEYACHEGNYALPGILAGARYEEEKAAKLAGSGGSEGANSATEGGGEE